MMNGNIMINIWLMERRGSVVKIARIIHSESWELGIDLSLLRVVPRKIVLCQTDIPLLPSFLVDIKQYVQFSEDCGIVMLIDKWSMLLDVLVPYQEGRHMFVNIFELIGPKKIGITWYDFQMQCTLS